MYDVKFFFFRGIVENNEWTARNLKIILVLIFFIFFIIIIFF